MGDLRLLEKVESVCAYVHQRCQIARDIALCSSTYFLLVCHISVFMILFAD
jgi:hypothetical protein